MPIVNALAGIMVNNLDAAVAWYEKVLDRPADKRPMDGLAEWQMPDGGWVQVYEDKERAGFSSVTFAVKGFEDQLEHLEAKAIPVEATTRSDYVKTATVKDPSGIAWSLPNYPTSVERSRVKASGRTFSATSRFNFVSRAR
jgi:catechol 2,3-dioxygenase-like lactoylglutathione lyase family enzyme